MKPILSRYVSALLQYPATWGGVLVVVLAHTGFNWWFSPSLSIQIIAGLLDAFCLVLLATIILKSDAFLELYQHRKYQSAMRAVSAIFAHCMDEFRTAAQACLTLSQRLHADFKNEPCMHEFEEFLYNITTMAENHRKLYLRSQQFGTAAQKEKMQALLDRQIHSMQQTLENLQAFSGNLTIMSARLEKSALAAKELQFINQGLQEVIQEMADA